MMTRSRSELGPSWPRASEPTAAKPMPEHRERDILAGRIPQLSEALHGQFRASFALGRTIPVDAVVIRLAHIHESLFQAIYC